METAPLKSFATWARTSLIREVTARIAVVLAPASPERVEQRGAVEALEKAVTAAGGGDNGKAAVADKVAYTWFNRIIALRFMDANGYTGVGVVSPQVGVQTGQPEILAEAKRGNFETDVVGGKTRETVTALLNGTRRSHDAQGEAYALLLADYCRYWNRAMPFMFEREGDFTELLIPANLLADDSVPSRAVKVLTKDVCQDVEVIGWLYQFYISERKDEVFAGFKKNQKAGAGEIPAATQLFTPHWIVRYIVENSLGRLWMLNRPTSHLVDQMQYYIAPVDEETDFLKIARPEELKVVDPACGSGHMLTYAFDLLYAVYEEEGYAPAEIPSLILTNNLYGVEIDPRAGALAAFALTMKARAKQRTFFNKQIEPNVCVLDPIRFTPDEIDFLLTRGGDKHAEAAFWNQFEHADTFGSLVQPNDELVARLKQHIAQLDDGGDILLADVLDWAERVVLQAEYLSRRYSVVVANPPYLSDKSYSDVLRKLSSTAFSSSKFNTYSMFIERAVALAMPCGFTGLIALHSWMSGAKYESFREWLLNAAPIVTLAHLGSSGFDSISGEVVSTAAIVFHPFGDRQEIGVFVDLTVPRGEQAKAEGLRRAALDPSDSGRFQRSVDDFASIPGRVIAYYASEAELDAFRRLGALGEVVDFRQGMATTDNGRFLRQWFEVSTNRIGFGIQDGAGARLSGRRWFPYNKGGAPRTWYGNQDLVVNWENDGIEIKNNIVRKYPYLKGKWGFVAKNPDYYFRPGLTYSALGGGRFAVRVSPPGFIFDTKGSCVFPNSDLPMTRLAGLMNSTAVARFLELLAPTLDFNLAALKGIPVPDVTPEAVDGLVEQAVATSKADWDDFETSWDFARPSFLLGSGTLSDRLDVWRESWEHRSEDQLGQERRINELVAEAYDLANSVETEVSLEDVSLRRNVRFTYGGGRSEPEYSALQTAEAVEELVSYAVGCMFGRYSLDEPGLILTDQGATLRDYLARVPNPTFAPDKDNVVPIVDGDWFEDDIVARFRTFLRVAFGEQHFEENLRFVTESLGVKDIRDYFVKSFYKDHVQRYKKRPIYWLFSSPKGSFNALIYMHRYTPSTVSTVLNEYLREFRAKLTSSLQQQERLAAGGVTPRQQAAAQKEADRLRKVLLELEEYEHDVLYPLASRQLAIDLDHGVKANYPKLGAALKKIPGLEASDE